MCVKRDRVVVKIAIKVIIIVSFLINFYYFHCEGINLLMFFSLQRLPTVINKYLLCDSFVDIYEQIVK